MRALIIMPGPTPDTCYVPLTNGYLALIDAADAKRVGEHRWRAFPRAACVYVITSVPGVRLRQHTLGLHRFLFPGIPPDLEVDHINHDGLDNRRQNLRIVTHAENQLNRRDSVHPHGESYIRWEPERDRFSVHILGRRYGRYRTIEEAVAARDRILHDLGRSI